MTDQANPVEPGALTVPQAAEAFRGLLGDGEAAATDETGNQAQTEPEQEAPEAEAEDAAPEDPDAENAQAEGADETAEASDPETDPEQEAEKAPRYAVKIDGQESRVTLEELKSGYQRDADYRRKTQKVAEERKAVEAERSHLKQVMDDLIPRLESAAQDKWAAVDWVKLANDDPAGYVAQKAAFEADMYRLSVAQQERQRVTEAEKAKQAEAIKARVAEERDKLLQAIPAFRDEKQAKVLSASIKTFLQSEGFTPDEIAGVMDHRALKLAHKAWLYDQSQKTKAVAQQKAQGVPRVIKPGSGVKESPATVARQKAAERLAKTGRVEDAAAFFKTII